MSILTPAGTFHGIQYLVKNEGICPRTKRWRKEYSGPLVECVLGSGHSKTRVLMSVDGRFNWEKVVLGAKLVVTKNGKVQPSKSS